MVAPLAGLALVVAVAWAGSIAEWLTPQAPLYPTGSGAPREDAAAPADIAATDLSGAPPVAFRLRVGTVEEVLGRRHAGELDDELLAVAGYLTVDPRDRQCAEANGAELSGAFCRRSAILMPDAERILEVNWDEDGAAAIRLGTANPHLHPQILPGTAIPSPLVTRPDPRVRELTPVPVVVIGRFDDPRALACHPGRRHCGEEFVLERVAWTAGRWADGSLVRDPALTVAETAAAMETAPIIASREVDRGEVVLSRALLTARLLREIDPLAGAAIDDQAGAVWYVRSVARPMPGDDGRALAWAVIDEAAGFVLAADP